ncbi:hypothetical protein EDB19DRAFT_1896989 [Suillus lakei]|nr:hypothetical protein EDB19DRAFT_1896989 [Suillus lakei]
MSVINTLLFTSLLILLPRRYIQNHFHNLHKHTSLSPFHAIVLLHSSYSLYSLIQRPPNLFSRLRIPLTLPIERIRALLLSEAGFEAGSGGDGGLAVPVSMPPDPELLLSRLKKGFGRRTLQICASCTSAGDYVLFVFAGAIIAYVRIANGRNGWRGYVLGVLVCAALAEGYVVSSVCAIPLPKDGIRVFMWHGNIQLARQALFLLPLLTQFLPPSEQPGPPRMWWAREKRAGGGEGVRRAALKMGLGYADAEGEEGKLQLHFGIGQSFTPLGNPKFVIYDDELMCTVNLHVLFRGLGR